MTECPVCGQRVTVVPVNKRACVGRHDASGDRCPGSLRPTNSGNRVDDRVETLFTVGMTLHPFRIRTTDREVTIQAESIQHAHNLFTGKAWPPGIPPAPRPANLPPASCTSGFGGPTPEWKAWYEDEFLPRRAEYPVLAWAHGECMSSVSPVSDDGEHVVSLWSRNGVTEMSCICGWTAEAPYADGAELAEVHVR